MVEHIKIARIERAIVVNTRRAELYHDIGLLDLEGDIRLELEYLKKCYFNYHNYTRCMDSFFIRPSNNINTMHRDSLEVIK